MAMPYAIAEIVINMVQFIFFLCVMPIFFSGSIKRKHNTKNKVTCTHLSTCKVSNHSAWGISYPGRVSSQRLRENHAMAGMNLNRLVFN